MSTNTDTNDVESLKDRLEYLKNRRETMVSEDWPDHKIESITVEIDSIAADLEERTKTYLMPGVPGYSDRLEAHEAEQ